MFPLMLDPPAAEKPATVDAPAPAGDSAGNGLPPIARAVAVSAVLAAMTLVVLDAGVTNVALPTMARALRIPAALTVLVVTAYQTGLIIALLPCAAFGERFGYRRVFAWGMALFVLASALSALSPSLPWLVAARFVQGLGGAAVMALGVPLLRFSVPGNQLGAAIGWNALTVALASSAGPTVGAIVLSHADWPWLYAMNIPLGLVVLVACLRLPRGAGIAQPLDRLSMVLSAGMFAALVTGAGLILSQPIAAIGLLATGVLCLATLVRREGPKAAPLIPLDLLRGRSFRLSVIASVFCFAGQAAAMIALPFYLQRDLGQSAATTGIYLTAWPLSVAVTAVVPGRLADRISTARLCALGGALLAVGLAGAALWPLQADVRPLLVCIVLCGAGFGLFQAPNNRNMFLAAPLKRSAASGGMQGTARLTGQTSGSVLMMLLFGLAPFGLAPRVGLGIGAVLALVAAGVSLGRGWEDLTGGSKPLNHRPSSTPR